ncbi:MAG: hypothetical protein QOG27_1473 [Verrucomicrobiota bacterium]|jgi:hypothetical protein
MKNIFCNSVIALLLIVASMAYGAVPPISVSVTGADGKTAFKGTTNSTGAFSTTKLQPGNYVVQLSSTSPAVKGNHYAVVVGAGKKKVSASAVPGEKLAGAGVALKVDVGSGLNITGQVAAEDKSAVNKSGKKMVWIPQAMGSHVPGHWVEEDSAEAKINKTRTTLSKDSINKMQEKAVNPQGN